MLPVPQISQFQIGATNTAGISIILSFLGLFQGPKRQADLVPCHTAVSLMADGHGRISQLPSHLIPHASLLIVFEQP